MIEMISHCMTCIAHLCYALRETYDALITLLSTICHRADIDQYNQVLYSPPEEILTLK